MERWLRSRTQRDNWFEVTWSKPPTLEDVDMLLEVLHVVRSGYTPMRAVPAEVCGIRVIQLPSPERAT